MDLESNKNNFTPSPAQAPPSKRARLVREKISQREIDEINDLYSEMEDDARKAVLKFIRLGEMLTNVKSRMRHGKWGPWVARNLKFHIRTAGKALKAYERRHEVLVTEDPAMFLSQVYGNEPKQLEEGKGVKKGKSAVDGRNDDENDEEKDDENGGSEKQHGGPGFEPGLLPDKFGKLALDLYREFESLLKSRVFLNPELTLEEKTRFASGLIGWLEYQKEDLARTTEEERGKDV